MAEEKSGKKSAAPKAKPQARESGVGGAGMTPTTTGPARLYGDDVPTPPSAAPLPPPKRGEKRGERPSPKPAGQFGAKSGGEAEVKPRESVAKGNKTPAVRTTKPKA